MVLSRFRGRFTESQIMAALKQFESGVPVNGLCRQVGVSPATFHKWKAKYGAGCFRALTATRSGRGNRRLKQMYADLSLHAHSMEIVLSKKF
ncbi:transposase [Rhodanobacter sp. A1T4]|uniref:transposase n=1 Tax=Rhodanobacter sp. A1T4 TaxID=2723087 RepID=UPI0031F30F6D